MGKYDWQDCPSVVALSEYLKSVKPHGLSLVLLDGGPALHISPGVIPADKDRWDALDRAVGMLRAAEHDLKHLIANKMIEIPGHPGWE
jgi:hypothetical protein